MHLLCNTSLYGYIECRTFVVSNHRLCPPHYRDPPYKHKRDIMLLRIRTKVATWRVEDVSAGMTIGDLKARILREHHVKPHESQVFSLDPGGKRVVNDTDTIQSLGLRHGDLLHFQIREEDCASELGKKIAADGTIINKNHLEASRERGFRPGMMSLRSMKMHWTLTDFVELDAQVCM